MNIVSKKILLVIVLLAAALVVFILSTRSKRVDYSTQVKPIFNKKCISCHGGVRRKSGFSLLFRADALAINKSGKPAIVPGDPGKSEMIRRLTLKDPEERMPYKHDPLSDKEITILRNWIKQGAPWGDHWAYVPVKQVQLPDVETEWAKNEIDLFIYDQLQKNKLAPSPQADKSILLRRASLDLIGMPAPEPVANKFLNDSTPGAFERLVDTLLSSPHFGERWTAMWMDLARYADTKGYEKDPGRTIWLYRDWLIKAFNEDKPYDVFLTEQIAGDLLPDPTDEQYIATGFHRNTMTNDEGGTDNEEFRTAAVIDRVNTTWEALMGTTFGCVQCHSHPYDPFRHEEYYKFMAFFNNTRDEDSEYDYPLLKKYDESQQQQLTSLITWIRENETQTRAKEMDVFLKTWQPTVNSLNADQFVNSDLYDTKYLILRNPSSARLKKINLEKKDHLIFRYVSWKPSGTLAIRLDSLNGPLLKTFHPDTARKWKFVETTIPIIGGVHDLYFTYVNPNLKNPEENGIMFDWFYFTEHFPGKGKKGFSQNKEKFWSLLDSKTPTIPIMMENPADMHRSTHVFERGNWLVKGEAVQPETPQALNPFPKDSPRNRLGLSRWVTSKENPLTARTIVNRLWEQLFGIGLAETLEDMGTQGIPPTHAELLDWLSWKVMNDYKWSIKKILKEMVMSATYQQDARLNEHSLEKDPLNKLYGRGARVRLSAEQVRDQALCLSGLISPKMFGPSVMPYQPDGIWLSPYSGEYWNKSQGEDQHRRALYTYWKRTAPYPSMMTFDAAAREVCTARRIRTNTPLQALVTLNDEAYLETARHFAYRMQKIGGAQVKDQISKGYEMAFYKQIPEAKLNVLFNLYNEALASFKMDKEKTCEMIGQMNEHNNPETAALVVVTNAMLNLDEMVTKN
jgi:mono/diheme cytochrome c family protein